MGKGRLEAFSDGVLAIIITIMVLELKIPEGTTWQSFKPVIPILLSYALSFIYIGIYWNNHHHLLHVVKRISAGIMWANLNLLFWLSLIPFTTAWMDENHFEPLPVAIYAALLAMCGLAYTILQKTIEICDENKTEQLKDIMNYQRRKGIISVIFYVTAIGFTYVTTIISGIFIVLVAIMWIIPDKKIERMSEG